jgi:hypothetical protein
LSRQLPKSLCAGEASLAGAYCIFTLLDAAGARHAAAPDKGGVEFTRNAEYVKPRG